MFTPTKTPRWWKFRHNDSALLLHVPQPRGNVLSDDMMLVCNMPYGLAAEILRKLATILEQDAPIQSVPTPPGTAHEARWGVKFERGAPDASDAT